MFFHYSLDVRGKSSDFQKKQMSWIEKALTDEKCVTAVVIP